MKRVLIGLFFFIVSSSSAQTIKTDSYKMKAGLHLGSYKGLNIGFNYVFKNKISIETNFLGGIREPESLPSNFENRLENNPADVYNGFEFLIGKYFNKSADEKFRFAIKTGISHSTQKKATNFRIDPANEYLDGVLGVLFNPFILIGNATKSNYDYSYEYTDSFGILVKPELEIVTSHKTAMSFAVNVNYILKDRTILPGFEINLLFGKFY